MIQDGGPRDPELRAGVRPLRVVHVSPFYWPAVGGAEQQIQSLSEGLAARGHHVTVLTQKHTGLTGEAAAALATTEVINGVRVIRLREWRWPSAALEALLRPRGSWRLLSALLGDERLRAFMEAAPMPHAWWHAVRLRPDVVGYSNYTFRSMAYAFLAAGRWRGFPVVGLPLLHVEDPWSHSAATRKLLLRSSALLVNTDFERRFVETLGVPASRARVLGNGVDPTAFAVRDGARVRAAHGFGDAPVVGYVGRLAPNKGVVTLIEAMQIVWRSVPEARLLLAGREFPAGSPQHRTVEAALGSLAPAERGRVVRLVGFAAQDKASIFDAMDVFAMPSTAESFGIAYLEAWFCERPVIGARIGAIECVVEHGNDGLLVGPGDAKDTAEAILALVRDPERRRRYGAAGRAKVEARYTWDRQTDVMERLYADLAQRRAGRRRAAGHPRLSL